MSRQCGSNSLPVRGETINGATVKPKEFRKDLHVRCIDRLNPQSHSGDPFCHVGHFRFGGHARPILTGSKQNSLLLAHGILIALVFGMPRICCK
jgi:hypothetical protein